MNRLDTGEYQLAVTRFQPEDDRSFSKKCGQEDLYISIQPNSPLALCPKIRLKDLDGLSIPLLQQIGFWIHVCREKTPHTRYLLQIEEASFAEPAENSSYPVFSSSYYLRRKMKPSGRVDIPIADPECHTDFYLVCPAFEKNR